MAVVHHLNNAGASSIHGGIIGVDTYLATAVVSKSHRTNLSTSVENRDSQAKAGHDGRQVLLKFSRFGSANGDGGQACSLIDGSCLLPKSMLDDTEKTIKSSTSKYRPCRSSSSCVHITAVMKALQRANPVGVELSGGHRPTSKSAMEAAQKDQHAEDLVIPGHPEYVPQGNVGARTFTQPAGSGQTLEEDEIDDDDGDGKPKKKRKISYRAGRRAKMNPFPESKVKTINKGCHDASGPCRQKLESLIALKRENQDDKGSLVGRGFKVEAVLEHGCNCTWSPAEGRWLSICDDCKNIKAVCLYDRGLTRVHLFMKAGIAVMVPHRKGSKQVTFSEVSAAQDRSIASERITIERNNVELRHFDGFDSQTTLFGVSLANWDGQVARGLANLKPKLTNWNDRSMKDASGNGLTLE